MKVIVNNDYHIHDDNLEVYRHKVRALVINDQGEIALTKYNGIYMLPGGKAEAGEQEKKSLAREIREELGIELKTEILTPLLNIKNYLKNYPEVGGIRRNRLTDTTYYFVQTNQQPNPDLIDLSPGEQSASFTVEWVALKDVTKLIQTYKSDNPRKEVFDRDLLTVVAVYLEQVIKEKKVACIDLHTHSYYSDGELSPEALIAIAKSEGVTTISITDHDSLDAHHELNNRNVVDGVKVIPGIEMTAYIKKGSMHILGYGIDVNNKELNEALKTRRNRNLNKILNMLSVLSSKYDIQFSREEIIDLVTANHNVGRPDIAKLLIKNGYIKTVQEAFDKYLIDVYEQVKAYAGELTYQDCIELITNAKGIPVLAHPKTIQLEGKELELLIDDMISKGLKGIEVYHPKHSQKDIQKYIKLAESKGLIITGGSDYHGPLIKPDVKLGVCNAGARVRRLAIVNQLTS